jgi:hypothetical protein
MPQPWTDYSKLAARSTKFTQPFASRYASCCASYVPPSTDHANRSNNDKAKEIKNATGERYDRGVAASSIRRKQ